MKTNELRIGNYVNFIGKREKVSKILESHVFFEGVEVGQWLSDVEPIPLTEQWLLDLGFHAIRPLFDMKRFKRGRFHVSHMLDEYKFVFKKDADSPYTPLRDIEFVHELQNLFFALTGEELTINNK